MCERCVKSVLTFGGRFTKLELLTSAPILGVNTMNTHRAAYKAGFRRNSGTSMAELPVVLWILFVGLLFPLLIYSSIGYRGSILYFAADSASKKAAKSATYTDASTRAGAVLSTILGPFSGIAVSAPPTISVMAKPIAGGAPTIYPGKVAAGAIDTTKYLYFVMSKVDADLSPLVQFGGGWMGMNIPGLTGPFHLTINTQAYAENPTGLSQ